MKTLSGLLAASNLHCCTLTKEESSEQHLSCISAQSGNAKRHNAAATVQNTHTTYLVTKSQNGQTGRRVQCSGRCSELLSTMDIRGLRSSTGKECDVITGRGEVRTCSEGIESVAVLCITEGTVLC